jgi:negative regulator of replication initiation
MALPEEIEYYSDTIDLPEVLERGLLRREAWGRPSIREVVDELARQLGCSQDHLGESAYDVLWDLLRVLEVDVEQEGQWEWLVHPEAKRHQRIAAKVVESQTIDDLLLASGQLGWNRRRMDEPVPHLGDVSRAVRTTFSNALADRVRKLLENWTKKNVWREDRARARRERMALVRQEETKRPLPPAS